MKEYKNAHTEMSIQRVEARRQMPQDVGKIKIGK
jgi:hypothetical protein